MRIPFLSKAKDAAPRKLLKPVIQPSGLDFRQVFSGRSIDPDTMGAMLDAGLQGDLERQQELFSIMFDTWPRLRSNLNKIKVSVTKLPWNIQPWSPKGKEPTATAIERASLIETALHGGATNLAENKINLAQTISNLVDSIAVGVTVLEVDWATRDRLILPTGTRRVPYSCLGFDISMHNPDAGRLMLYPERNRHEPHPFERYPNKFLLSIFPPTIPNPGACAQLRALAPLWLGRLLGYEWMLSKTELFGIPLRYATYDEHMPDSQVQLIANMLQQMGAAAWGAFPKGTDINILSNGIVPGVAGPTDPNERLMIIADKACDLLFLGQTLTSDTPASGGTQALGRVHREVELDLFEGYANHVAEVLNHQLIPSIIQLNYGDREELPYIEVEIPRLARDKEIVERDKLLFVDMALPVSRQWLYERHKVPAPGKEDVLYDPPNVEPASSRSSPPTPNNPRPGTE